jgi:hypothetical protein
MSALIRGGARDDARWERVSRAKRAQMKSPMSWVAWLFEARTATQLGPNGRAEPPSSAGFAA